RGAVRLVGHAAGQALPQQQPNELGMRRLVVEGAPGELADLLEAGGDRRHRGGEPVELVGEHGLEQRLLVAEVLVQALLVDPGPFGDAGHGRAVRPVLGELRRGRLLEAPAGSLGVPGHAGYSTLNQLQRCGWIIERATIKTQPQRWRWRYGHG